jgi:hypothetical protein
LVRKSIRRRARLAALSVTAALSTAASAQDGAPATIEQVKQSIVAVGSFERTRGPAFSFAGTGFAVGDGLGIAPTSTFCPELNSERNGTLAIAARGGRLA